MVLSRSLSTRFQVQVEFLGNAKFCRCQSTPPPSSVFQNRDLLVYLFGPLPVKSKKKNPKQKRPRKPSANGIKCQMLVTVSAVQVDHAGQALSQPQSRPGHQQVSTINILPSYQCIESAQQNHGVTRFHVISRDDVRVITEDNRERAI